MREAQEPQGISFVTPATTPPVGAPDPCGGANSQFGVEQNQVRSDEVYTGLTLNEKAVLDLAGKVKTQRVQYPNS